jgi:hypothetical protein
MASTFKTFLANDITTTKTLLHEAIPITGTIVSGTYKGPIDSNIKTFSHGMFESVYDYPYLSSSANHIFDITAGYASGSKYQSGSGAGGFPAGTTQDTKKINIYNQFAQVLVPYDVSGNIQQFDKDGDIASGGPKMDSCYFISFSRLLTKDEIKKGNFRFSFYTDTSGTHAIPDVTTRQGKRTFGDYGAATSYKVNSPTGEYGLILTSSTSDPEFSFGHIYYQAGVLVLTSSIVTNEFCFGGAPLTDNTLTGTLEDAFKSCSIDQIADGIRFATDNVEFNNTTELNSTMYFCRANTNEYNYSANPTYLDASKIVVKGDNAFEEPVSYITTVGLYSADNELLATAKVSEPLKKAVSNEVTLRVRLDY